MARKTDKVGTRHSFASALRARRIALEGGDPSAARDAYLKELKVKEAEAKRKEKAEAKAKADKK